MSPKVKFLSENWVLICLLLFGTVGLGYFTEQSEFPKIFLFYFPFFAAYAYLIFSESPEYLAKATRNWLWVAVGLRLVLLFAFPGLSDDLYRFVWDGRLWAAGVNPFDYLPTHFMAAGNEIEGLNQALFDELNSPEYFTIYPPICQGVFYVASAIFPNSIFGSMLIMKAFMIVCEIGTIFLLPRIFERLNLPIQNSLIYALNPLIIIEISGNLHFEGAMVFFLVLSIFLLIKDRMNWSAVAFAGAVASKLLPLLFLPYFLRKFGWLKTIQFGLIVGLVSIAMFIPILSNQFITNFGNSLNLYFQKFEFNGSIYYLARWWGYQKSGHNLIAQIGPVLALLSSSIIVLMALLKKKPTLPKFAEYWMWAIVVYLIFTPTVHPWYVTLPLLLCGFGNYRFPVIWSFFIFLTYINYNGEVYQERIGFVALEYLIVFSVMVSEIRKFGIKKEQQTV